MSSEPNHGLLVQLGRRDEAERDYERLLDHAREGEAGDAPLDVAIARYFLGQHHLDDGACAQAIATVEPSIDAGETLHGLLFVVQALALHGLGRTTEARAAADAALAVAEDEKRRAAYRDDLALALNGQP